MKRALLIAGGTIGGLGAVLAITPPQLGATSLMSPIGSSSSAAGSIVAGAGASSTPAAGASASQSASATAVTSKSVVPAANQLALPTKCGDDDGEYGDDEEDDDNYNCKQVAVAPAPVVTKAAATKAATPTATATKTAAPVKTTAAAPVKTAAAAPASKAINGTFTGPSVFVNYGNVQVKITVANGKITDAVAVVAPSGRNDRYTNMAVPILKKQTLAAQSASIQGASGASYTSYGWQKSLQGALADAGL